jgi:hypothetical protein
MEPSPSWYFHYKLNTQTVIKKDLEIVDGYILNILHLSYFTLQNTPEINKVYSLSVFLLHYFINKLLHFRISFRNFANHFLKIEFEPKQISFNITQCVCIYCKFPDIQSDTIETTLQQYFNKLQKQPLHIQTFMLSVLEKCFDIQCLHTMILQYQYPHLDNEIIQNFVTTYYNPK